MSSIAYHYDVLGWRLSIMNAVAEIETGLFLVDLFLDLCEILRYPITAFL